MYTPCVRGWLFFLFNKILLLIKKKKKTAKCKEALADQKCFCEVMQNQNEHKDKIKEQKIKR